MVAIVVEKEIWILIIQTNKNKSLQAMITEDF